MGLFGGEPLIPSEGWLRKAAKCCCKTCWVWKTWKIPSPGVFSRGTNQHQQRAASEQQASSKLLLKASPHWLQLTWRTTVLLWHFSLNWVLNEDKRRAIGEVCRCTSGVASVGSLGNLGEILWWFCDKVKQRTTTVCWLWEPLWNGALLIKMLKEKVMWGSTVSVR